MIKSPYPQLRLLDLLENNNAVGAPFSGFVSVTPGVNGEDGLTSGGVSFSDYDSNLAHR